MRDGGLIGRRHAETLCDGRNDLYTDWVLVYTGEHFVNIHAIFWTFYYM